MGLPEILRGNSFNRFTSRCGLCRQKKTNLRIRLMKISWSSNRLCLGLKILKCLTCNASVRPDTVSARKGEEWCIDKNAVICCIIWKKHRPFSEVWSTLFFAEICWSWSLVEMSLVERFIFRPSKVGCRGSLALSIPRALSPLRISQCPWAIRSSMMGCCMMLDSWEIFGTACLKIRNGTPLKTPRFQKNR